MATTTKQVKSVPAVSSVSVPCGTPFSHLFAATLPKIPSTLIVTFDDNSTLSLPITWTMGQYDPWDNIGKVVSLKGNIALPSVDSAGNPLRNDANVYATCQVTTTVVTGPGTNSGSDDIFCNRPGQETGAGRPQP